MTSPGEIVETSEPETELVQINPLAQELSPPITRETVVFELGEHISTAPSTDPLPEPIDYPPNTDLSTATSPVGQSSPGSTAPSYTAAPLAGRKRSHRESLSEHSTASSGATSDQRKEHKRLVGGLVSYDDQDVQSDNDDTETDYPREQERPSGRHPPAAKNSRISSV